jgi:hypothetical protein
VWVVRMRVCRVSSSDLGDVVLIIVECLCVGLDASDAHTISSTRAYRDKGCLKAAGLPRELE